jgi:dihydroxyacetone kinase-like predicted kinase
MKKHIVGAVYEVNKKNMNHLIKQLEEATLKANAPTVTFQYPNTSEFQYDINCHKSAIEANLDVYEALQVIRGVLKHQEPAEHERATLEKLREILTRNHVYE